MVKKVLALLISTVVGSSLYAGNYDSGTKGFLGVEVGYASVDGDKFGGIKHEGSAAEYGLRFGSQTDEWRATFAFDYFNSDGDDQSAEKAFLMVDYFFLNDVSGMDIKPFVGGNIGYINYESTLVESSDFAYGGQAGIVVGVGDSVDLDLSYRYSISLSDKVNDLGSIVFGLNYLY